MLDNLKLKIIDFLIKLIYVKEYKIYLLVFFTIFIVIVELLYGYYYYYFYYLFYEDLYFKKEFFIIFSPEIEKNLFFFSSFLLMSFSLFLFSVFINLTPYIGFLRVICVMFLLAVFFTFPILIFCAKFFKLIPSLLEVLQYSSSTLVYENRFVSIRLKEPIATAASHIEYLRLVDYLKCYFVKYGVHVEITNLVVHGTMDDLYTPANVRKIYTFADKHSLVLKDFIIFDVPLEYHNYMNYKYTRPYYHDISYGWYITICAKLFWLVYLKMYKEVWLICYLCLLYYFWYMVSELLIAIAEVWTDSVPSHLKVDPNNYIF